MCEITLLNNGTNCSTTANSHLQYCTIKFSLLQATSNNVEEEEMQLKPSHILIISAILATSYLAGLVILATEIRCTPNRSKYDEDKWAWRKFRCRNKKRKEADADVNERHKKLELLSMRSFGMSTITIAAKK